MKNLTYLAAFISLSIFSMGAEISKGKPEARTALKPITIPVIRLEGVSLGQAVDLLRSRSIELDTVTRDPKLKGTLIHFAHIKLKDVNKITINYSKEDISLKSALVEFAKQAKMDLYLTSVGIVYCPSDKEPFPNTNTQKGEVLETLHIDKN